MSELLEVFPIYGKDTYHVGFTGTQDGLTQGQTDRLIFYFENTKDDTEGWYFHHGDCIGADLQAATIAKSFGWEIVGHPPKKADRRAFFPNDYTYPEKDYLVRNKDIVTCSHELIGCPRTHVEELRSGTWSTIRHAGRVEKYTLICNPDGVWIQPKGQNRIYLG